MTSIAAPETLAREVRRTFPHLSGAAWRTLASLKNRTAVALFTWLQSHREGWRTTYEDIAEAIGCSVRTVSRCIRALIEEGWLRLTPTQLVLEVPGQICRPARIEPAGSSAGKKKHSTTSGSVQPQRPTKEAFVNHPDREDWWPSPELRTDPKPPDDNGYLVDELIKAMRKAVRKNPFWGRNDLAHWICHHYTRTEIDSGLKMLRGWPDCNSPLREFCKYLDKLLGGSVSSNWERWQPHWTCTEDEVREVARLMPELAGEALNRGQIEFFAEEYRAGRLQKMSGGGA